jgi:hypothetical protein
VKRVGADGADEFVEVGGRADASQLRVDEANVQGMMTPGRPRKWVLAVTS